MYYMTLYHTPKIDRAGNPHIACDVIGFYCDSIIHTSTVNQLN